VVVRPALGLLLSRVGALLLLALSRLPGPTLLLSPSLLPLRLDPAVATLPPGRTLRLPAPLGLGPLALQSSPLAGLAPLDVPAGLLLLPPLASEPLLGPAAVALALALEP
jgi:hypothetical protein